VKIKIAKDAICGKVFIPAGEYWVSLAAESGSISLIAGGKNLGIPAVKRKSVGRSKTTSVNFYSGGGNLWSLVIDTPKAGQWIATIEYSKSARRDDDD
jgi:hypothetical protein